MSSFRFQYFIDLFLSYKFFFINNVTGLQPVTYVSVSVFDFKAYVNSFYNAILT
jgi:hypothetical protein